MSKTFWNPTINNSPKVNNLFHKVNVNRHSSVFLPFLKGNTFYNFLFVSQADEPPPPPSPSFLQRTVCTSCQDFAPKSRFVNLPPMLCQFWPQSDRHCNKAVPHMVFLVTARQVCIQTVALETDIFLNLQTVLFLDLRQSFANCPKCPLCTMRMNNYSCTEVKWPKHPNKKAELKSHFNSDISKLFETQTRDSKTEEWSGARCM